MKRLLAGMALAILTASGAAGGEVGFVEDFALAKDRAAALRQLIPGTEDYYYYHALHYLNTEQFDKVERAHRPVARAASARRPAHRDPDPPRPAHLRQGPAEVARLPPRPARPALRPPEGDRSARRPNLPTALDPKLIARDTLQGRLARPLAQPGQLRGRRPRLAGRREPDLGTPPQPAPAAAPAGRAEPAEADRRRPEAAARPRRSARIPIHRQLTLAQLDELLKLQPDLLNQTGLRQRLRRQAAARGRRRLAARPRPSPQAYLDRLQAFVRPARPGPQRAQGPRPVPPPRPRPRRRACTTRRRFLAYLKLPRHQPYMAKALLRSAPSRAGYPADLNADFTRRHAAADRRRRRAAGAQLPASTSSSTADSPKRVRAVHRRRLPARTCSPRRRSRTAWATRRRGRRSCRRSCSAQLKDRIDIDFAFTNKTDFAADEPVKLDLFVKNVPTLMVKVFEINTPNFYRDAAARGGHRHQPRRPGRQRRADAHLRRPAAAAGGPHVRVPAADQAGRVRHRLHRRRQEQPGAGPQGPAAAARRHRHRRAERHAWSTTPNQPVKDATVWLGGQEYRADKDGRSSCRSAPAGPPADRAQPRRLRLPRLPRPPAGELPPRPPASTSTARALLTQRVAPMLVRPGLFLNGTPVSVKLLEEVQLRITVDRPRRHRHVHRGAELQAVRGPRIDPRVPRARPGWRR